MISSKKLLQLARMWRMAAEIGRKKTNRVAQKGHFPVYTTDGGRFNISVSYLGNGVIRDIFILAEEEFGITSEGPIVLPLDASLFMKHLLSLIGRGLASELKKASLLSHIIVTGSQSITRTGIDYNRVILTLFSGFVKDKISSIQLLQLAKKWQMASAVGRKRVSFGRTSSKKFSGHAEKAPKARKGHFAVYTTDGKRFEVNLSYLANGVIRELFAIAEEEFGIPGEGTIVLPLDASPMEYVMSMIRLGLAPEKEKALLGSFTRCRSGIYFAVDKARACPQIVCM